MRKVNEFINSATAAIFISVKESLNRIETTAERELIDAYSFEVKRLLGEFIELYFIRFPKDHLEDWPIVIRNHSFTDFLEDFTEELDSFYIDVESMPEIASVVSEMLKISSLTLSRYRVL